MRPLNLCTSFVPMPAGGRDAGKHRDPISGDTFTNASKLVVLKATGDVVLKETYDMLIKPEGKMNGAYFFLPCVEIVFGAC